MFNLTRLVILFVILVGVNGLVRAQQNKMPTPTEIAQKNVDELDKRLKLNGTQKSVIYSFTYNQAKEQAELIKRQQAGNSKEEDVDKFYKLQNETSKNIRNVLRPEQQLEYDKVIEERLSGKSQKNKKKKKGEEEVESDIKGLLSSPPVEKQNQ